MERREENVQFSFGNLLSITKANMCVCFCLNHNIFSISSIGESCSVSSKPNQLLLCWVNGENIIVHTVSSPPRLINHKVWKTGTASAGEWPLGLCRGEGWELLTQQSSWLHRWTFTAHGCTWHPDPIKRCSCHQPAFPPEPPCATQKKKNKKKILVLLLKVSTVNETILCLPSSNYRWDQVKSLNAWREAGVTVTVGLAENEPLPNSLVFWTPQPSVSVSLHRLTLTFRSYDGFCAFSWAVRKPGATHVSITAVETLNRKRRTSDWFLFKLYSWEPPLSITPALLLKLLWYSTNTRFFKQYCPNPLL